MKGETVIYSTSEEGKAFVHANCDDARERKLPYSGVLYLVLFDTSLESESVTLYSKFEIKINHIFGWICFYGKK
jgi:hypothetical protein